MAISPTLTARGYMKANAALLAGVPLEQAHNTLEEFFKVEGAGPRAAAEHAAHWLVNKRNVQGA